MLPSTKKLAGIWIDHDKAWIVRYDRGVESILKLESAVESHVRETGGSGKAMVPHHKIEGRRHEHAKKFYHQVMEKIKDVDALVLMGPSSAKQELNDSIEKDKNYAGKVRELLPADHMTDRQIAARVREFFHLGNDLASLVG